MAKEAKQSDKDLMKELSAKREALRNFRFGMTGTKIRNVKEGRNLRKDVARLLTDLSARKKK